MIGKHHSMFWQNLGLNLAPFVNLNRLAKLIKFRGKLKRAEPAATFYSMHVLKEKSFLEPDKKMKVEYVLWQLGSGLRRNLRLRLRRIGHDVHGIIVH